MSILAEILAHKQTEVAAAKAAVPRAELLRRARAQPPTRSLATALRRPPDAPPRVIAEIKRASPSAGQIRPGAEPGEIARSYHRAGASAISVLTDERFFAGELAFLARVRDAMPLPVLRKDFLIDAYQVVEARAHGADAVLLIVAALSDGQLRELLAAAAEHGLDALVEVHDEVEAARAVAANATIIGVNHRSLATFAIDMSLTERLRPLLPAEAIMVGESGIHDAADLARLAAAGADAVLVGTSLMRADDPGAALAELLR